MAKIYYQTVFVLLVIFISIFGCSEPDKNYYQINKVRVVASLFQNSSLLSGSSLTSTSSQQYPLRLVTSSTSCATTHFYFILLSPSNEVPILTINNIVLYALGDNYLSSGGGARGIAAGTKGTNIAQTFFFTSTTPTTTTIQTIPFRITILDYNVNCSNLTVANLNSYMNQVNDFPGFQLSYSVSSGVSDDQGFYSFYFLPEPTDIWWTTTTFPSSLSSAKILQVKNGLAVTNNPIQISSMEPSGNTVLGNSENLVIANISLPPIPSPRDPHNSIFNAVQRLQWYVSAGSLSLDTDASTTWSLGLGANNTVGGFVVLRDLLGGVDFKLLGPFTTQ